MTKLLVTGSAGFIGSHFVDFALQKGHAVVGIDDLSYGKIENVNKESKFFQINICDYSVLQDIILSEKPNAIIHFAANATTKSSAMGWKDPMADYRINMVGTLNILEIIRENNLNSHFLYASSAAVYGEPEYVPIDERHPNNPLSPYGVSKLAGEKYCYAFFHEYNIPTTILRIFNTFGPRQPRYVMYDQIKKMLPNPKSFEVLGTGEQLRDYVFISDTVRAIYLCINNQKVIGEILNIGSGQQISIRQLIHLIKSVIQVDSQDIYTGESWKGDISKLWADIHKISDTINWRSEISLEDGLDQLVAWIRENE